MFLPFPRLKPKNIGFMEAGGMPKVALTSYKALVWYAAAPWSTSPRVLILGGSGGTGTMAIQVRCDAPVACAHPLPPPPSLSSPRGGRRALV